MHATEVAVNLTKISDASVTTLYVVDVHRLAQHPGYSSLPGSNDQLNELMFREGNGANAKIAEMAQDAGVPCEKIIAEAHPSEEISRRSKESGMDLLAIGSIDRSGLKRPR